MPNRRGLQRWTTSWKSSSPAVSGGALFAIGQSGLAIKIALLLVRILLATLLLAGLLLPTLLLLVWLLAAAALLLAGLRIVLLLLVGILVLLVHYCLHYPPTG